MSFEVAFIFFFWLQVALIFIAYSGSIFFLLIFIVILIEKIKD